MTFVAGCASLPAAPKNERSPDDPWEPLNRQIHGFNTGLDKITLKPIAKAWQKVVPQWMRTGVGNFSENLRAPLHAINHFLQGKPKSGFKSTGRFLMNSTVGIGGLLDAATDAGLEKEPEGFGQTFAVWGMPKGPYVVLPIFGPRTFSDALAIPLNWAADPLIWYRNSSVRDKIYFVRLIDVRQRLFKAEQLIEGSADPYVAIREAYLQRREYLILDGEIPEDEDPYDDLFDEEFEDEEDY